jgi:hypothetical protein
MDWVCVISLRGFTDGHIPQLRDGASSSWRTNAMSSFLRKLSSGRGGGVMPCSVRALHSYCTSLT